MGFWNNLFGRGRPSYEKDYSGNETYLIESGEPYASKRKNLHYAQDHPILTGALLFISNLFAQGRFIVKDKATGEVVKNHKWIKLLDRPNFYQSRIDFLESVQFLKIAQGRAIIWLRRPTGFSMPEELYILRDDLIVWPDGFQTPLEYRGREPLKQFKEQYVLFDPSGLNIHIQIKDLMFLYDMPNIGKTYGSYDNGSGLNMLNNGSRLDGLEQTLLNTYDSLTAKNVILQSNGKEMLKANANANGQAPFTPEETKKAKAMFNTAYGLGHSRSRAFITSSDVSWQSMHVALRDLGLDESVKVDGNLIYTALHIPKDILSLEAKKTTYNNFKESMTSYIQNDIQAMANDFAEAFWNEMDDDTIEIIGSYDHLPVMQFAMNQQYEARNTQAIALNNLLKTGIKEPDALRMVGLPSTMELNERQDISETAITTAETDQGADQENQGGEAE